MTGVENHNRMYELAKALTACQVPLDTELMGRLERQEPTTADARAIRTIEKSLARVGRTDGLIALLDSFVRREPHPSAASDQNQYSLARALRVEIEGRLRDDFRMQTFNAGVWACI